MKTKSVKSPSKVTVEITETSAHLLGIAERGGISPTRMINALIVAHGEDRSIHMENDLRILTRNIHASLPLTSEVIEVTVAKPLLAKMNAMADRLGKLVNQDRAWGNEYIVHAALTAFFAGE